MEKSKRILEINSTLHGSTGTIMLNISKVLKDNNYEVLVSYPKSRTNSKKNVDYKLIIGNIIGRNFHRALAYLTGCNGCFSKLSTRKYLKKIKQYSPDAIHLHNLHNCYVNLEVLFEFLKKNKIPVVWTLHDCWAFTGQCPHYTKIGCDKWKTQCFSCPQYKQYPKSIVDRTRTMYQLKKKWFNGVENMTLVTPSSWLKGEVKKSFLNNYQIKTINNGIDLDIFKPVKSDFRRKYDIIDKKILLGVANPWSEKKGLHIFESLSKHLDDKYQIILVGVSEKQTSKLPDNIIGIPRTLNQNELVKIYSAADIFINPSIEETMGMVTLEAMACGTPVIVSNYTAVPESVCEKCGVVVEDYSVEGFISGIKKIENMNLSSEILVKQASLFDKEKKYREYLTLFSSILNCERRDNNG